MLADVQVPVLLGQASGWVRDANSGIIKSILTANSDGTPKVNTVDFTIPDDNAGYFPWVETALNTDPPKVTSMKQIDANTIRMTTTPITIAQTGGSGTTSGNKCYLQMQIVY